MLAKPNHDGSRSFFHCKHSHQWNRGKVKKTKQLYVLSKQVRLKRRRLALEAHVIHDSCTNYRANLVNAWPRRATLDERKPSTTHSHPLLVCVFLAFLFSLIFSRYKKPCSRCSRWCQKRKVFWPRSPRLASILDRQRRNSSKSTYVFANILHGNNPAVTLTKNFEPWIKHFLVSLPTENDWRVGKDGNQAVEIVQTGHKQRVHHHHH